MSLIEFKCQKCDWPIYPVRFDSNSLVWYDMVHDDIRCPRPGSKSHDPGDVPSSKLNEFFQLQRTAR